jgi:nitroreductase
MKKMLAFSLFFEAMDSRRSTREFSDRPVPREVIENLIKLHLQPFRCAQATLDFFVVENPAIKKQILPKRKNCKVMNPHRVTGWTI